MKLRMLELQNLMPFFSYLPIEIAKIKPPKYCLAKIAKLSTREIKYQ